MCLSFQKIKNFKKFLVIIHVSVILFRLSFLYGCQIFRVAPLFCPRPGLFLKTVGFEKIFFKKIIYIWIKMDNFIILAITLSVILVTVIILKVFA